MRVFVLICALLDFLNNLLTLTFAMDNTLKSK